jgi:ubiquitin carboxyl-terminal hydrolase 7
VFGDLIAGLARRLNLDEPTSRQIRILEANGAKITKELSEDTSVVGVNEFTTLYAEKIPDEEQQANPETDKIVSCIHFDKEPSKPHGIPFKFVLKAGETTADMRERISKRTGIKGKLLQNIKFAIVPRGVYAKPRYLEDEDIPADLISVEGSNGTVGGGAGGDEMLGLDHVGKSRTLWGRAEGMFIR